MKRGFTLVELSIVLVIIGLLVGGILVAQSMIHTVKVQKFIRQVQQFDVAVSNFQTKFNSLPGDSIPMGCITVTSNICGNGLIEDDTDPETNGYNGYIQNYDGENAKFWPQLQQSGFTNPGGGTFTDTITGNFTTKDPLPNSPQMTLGDDTGVMITTFSSSYFNVWGFGLDLTNYYVAGDYTSTTSGAGGISASVQESIPVADALAIDTKIDNGEADSDFMGPQSKVLNFAGQFGATDDTCSGGTDAYNVSDPTARCMLMIKMLTTNSVNSQ